MTVDQTKSSQDKNKSLEVLKIGVTLLLAVVGGIFTFVTYLQGRQDKDRDRNTESLRRAAEQRLVVWNEAAPILNDIYVYNMYVGRFNELTPKVLIKDKREMDRLMYSHEVLFNRDYFQAYLNFMKTAFRTNTGWEKDPELRTVPVRKHDMDDKDVLFTNEDCRKEIFKAYWRLQELSAKELNVFEPEKEEQPRPTGIPVPAQESACQTEQ